jgi:hypothetical protein
LIVVAAGGWLMTDVLGSGLSGLFAVAAAAIVILGLSMAAIFKWRVVSPTGLD